jgi:hypothetical protein
VANQRTRYSNRSSSEETLTEEMKKDDMLSRNCLSRQKADGPTHHSARTRLISLANRGDRASRGRVPGKKVLRMYSGTPNKLLGLPGLAAFRMSIVSKAWSGVCRQAATVDVTLSIDLRALSPNFLQREDERQKEQGAGHKVLLVRWTVQVVTSKHSFFRPCKDRDC